MQDYQLITDDSCDLPPAYYVENDIAVMYLSFTMDGKSYTSKDMPPKEFYAGMRAGRMPITAQVSVKDWLGCFEPYLQEGRDILYIGFSSALSGTCGSAQVAARELAEKYPDRKIVVVDSLCASLGQGLLLHKVNALRRAGKPLEEAAQWAEENRLRVSHMVAVDDLMHLHRGGRVSKASAVAGSMLGIKPIIHMSDEGKLVPIDKVRGRKQSLQKIVDKSVDLAGGVSNDIFMVCHSDCEEEANAVADLVAQRLGIGERIIHFIGPVIGTHTGPGTIAVFLMADHR